MIYKLMPEKYKRKVKELLVYSGSRRSPASFTNASFIVSILAGIVAYYISGPSYGPVVSVAIFLGLFAFLHELLALAVERRAKFAESILPDALQLMAANSRAGYIPIKALLLSARSEFGPLSEAIKMAGKELMTGKTLEDSLKAITNTIKSQMLEKTVNLIAWGAKSGGQFAELLEQNAEDIRRMQAISKEVRANVTMYVIFIGFAGCVGAPVLYALSSFLTETIGRLGTVATLPETFTSNTSFLRFSGVSISPEFLFVFSILAIFITTFFAGLILGSIASGSQRAGVKYIPFLMIVGYGTYFATKYFIEANFGVLIP